MLGIALEGGRLPPYPLDLANWPTRIVDGTPVPLVRLNWEAAATSPENRVGFDRIADYVCKAIEHGSGAGYPKDWAVLRASPVSRAVVLEVLTSHYQDGLKKKWRSQQLPATPVTPVPSPDQTLGSAVEALSAPTPTSMATGTSSATTEDKADDKPFGGVTSNARRSKRVTVGCGSATLMLMPVLEAHRGAAQALCVCVGRVSNLGRSLRATRGVHRGLERAKRLVQPDLDE
jgi:hypothetical protein